MVITTKPKKPTTPPMDERERARLVEAFIEGTPNGVEAKTGKRTPMKPIPVRFDEDMRGRVETIAARRGQSAAAWIRMVVSQALEAEEIR